jgi:uncharacterized protein
MTTNPFEAAPHFPRPAPIESYGNGGFRFAEMSHRGSILCLPAGIWAWPVSAPEEITEDTLAPVFAAAADLSLFFIGTGRGRWQMPDALRWRFHEKRINLEVADTGRAITTFNILLGEGRKVGAGLIAVE